MRVLVIGVSGMLGSEIYQHFLAMQRHSVFGTVRTRGAIDVPLPNPEDHIIGSVTVENQDSIVRAIGIAKPDAVINCVGLVKQISESDDPLRAIPINSIFPHQLSRLCSAIGARLIHISTDCVFSGTKGMYKEEDFADADDLYGRTKLLGEVLDGNSVTIRTSIIGQELFTSRSLVNWFLAQKGTVKGYKKALFSGLPTVEIARIIHDLILPEPQLSGLYHVASPPISKYLLLKKISTVFGKENQIVLDDSIVIDRTLDDTRFRVATRSRSPGWDDLVLQMHSKWRGLA